MKQAIFFGNCQATAIQRILADHAAFASTYEVIPVRAVHVLTESEKSRLLDSVGRCDLVIHQPVSSVYAPATTENIISAVRSHAKSITFPVCWFDAYAPDQVYLRGKINGRLLMDYHSRLVFAGYVRGLSPAHVAQAHDRPDLYSVGALEANVDANLRRLEEREAGLDIKTAPFIRDNYRLRNLFFTFNHPTGWLLYHVIDQILERIGLPGLTPDVKKTHAAILGSYRWRGSRAVYSGLNLAFPAPEIFARGAKHWSTEQFAADWYRFYDANPDLVSAHANVSLNGANL